MPVIESYWQLFVPSDYEVTRSGGNLKDVADSVLIGGKLKSNMNEVERLMKIADNSQTSIQKRNALRGVARKQQELSDYCVESKMRARSCPTRPKRAASATTNFKSSWRAIASSANRPATWTQTLQAAQQGSGGGRRERRRRRTAAGFSRQLQFPREWLARRRAVKKACGNAKTTPRRCFMAAAPQHASLRRLCERRIARPAARADQRTSGAASAGPGLRDDSSELHLEKNPIALIVPEMGTKLTYSRLEGHPQLTVTLRSKTSSWRYSSIAGLLLAIAIAAFIYRRRSKSTRPV